MHKCPDRAVMSYSYLTQSASATSLQKMHIFRHDYEAESISDM